MGMWLIVAGSASGLALSIFNFFWPHNGIHGSGGALLVIVGTALLLGASLLMALDRSASRSLRILIVGLLFLGIVGTGFAAYMLDASLLVGLMVLALIGWLVHLFAGPGEARRAAGLRPGAVS
jgi:hypothetical protein